MTNIEEIWKSLPYSSHYEVSNIGNVRSVGREVINTRAGSKRIVPPAPVAITDNGRGYKLFSTSLSQKRKNFYIHRAVAELFIPNPLNLPEVNHKDGDKSNNAFWNLEWVDRIGNLNHAIANGLRPEKVVINLETGIFYKNVKEAMFSFGYTKTAHSFRNSIRGIYPTIKLPFVYA